MVDTLAFWCGEGDGHKCGYCKSKDTSLSYGMALNWSSCQTYQCLIDRGWRRSGTYCYKPSMDRTCCPQYTIKCDTVLFRPSRSQKKCIKTFNSFLLSDIKVPTNKVHHNNDTPAHNEAVTKNGAASKEGLTQLEKRATAYHPLKPSLNPSKHSQVSSYSKLTPRQFKTAAVLAASSKKRDKRRLRRLTKIASSKGVDVNSLDVRDLGTPVAIPTLEERLTGSDRLVLKLVKISDDNPDFLDTFQQSFEVYKAYQMEIHGDKPEKCCENTFKRFLCDPPFKTDDHLGAFHHQYWLDGVLVAVGVIDVLPQCVSSVYFYYLPKFAPLTFGTYSALQEIKLTKSLSVTHPEIKWYYMGYYIHTCPKMRYKGAFSGSYLLCPKDYTWWSIRECVPKLEQSSYCVFSNTADNSDIPQSVDFSQMFVVHANKIYQYGLYRSVTEKDIYSKALVKLVELAGYETARGICLYISPYSEEGQTEDEESEED